MDIARINANEDIYIEYMDIDVNKFISIMIIICLFLIHLVGIENYLQTLFHIIVYIFNIYMLTNILILLFKLNIL